LYQPAFNKLMENTAPGNDSLTAFTELMLTAQYLMYAKNVWEGVDEKESIAMEWLLPRKKISYTQLLDSLISGKDVLENAPVYRQYYLRKDYLKKYKALEAADTSVIPANQSFKQGDSSASIRKIRHKLFLYADIAEDNNSAVVDEALNAAVKSFQQRTGLTVNGAVSSSLINELNIPVHKRIEQILVNMERSRWVPENQQPDYLLINIPEYKMHVYENDSLAWDMNVVVGKDQHRTVIFNGDMKYIVFSPYWNIPASILKNETLPAIKRNPNYLASHNMEWNGGNVRQKPGPNNSLGLVKFLFPNSHAIYLHDSPAKSLFNETNRAFSHGCIRLSDPKKLAIYLLRNDSAWNEPKITAAMNKGKEQYVTLKKTVPVFIAYFTAWVARDGKLNFRNDIYKRDTRLSDMILKTPGG
jgi:L,D-transpeptidase YcbB